MLGTDLSREFAKRGIPFEVFDLPEFDITNEGQLSKIVQDSKAIVNCAAYTDVEKAEHETSLAYRVNAEAVGRLGHFAKQEDKWVLHISTDFVFDGKSDKPYVETDTPNPVNTYGASKLAGEQLLVESGCRHCIMRIQWTYGLYGRNFVIALVERAKERKKLKVVDDQIGSPTATTEVAKVIYKMLANMPEGIFHFASDGYVSRFEMAEFVFDRLNIPVDLNRCKTRDYPSAAARPLNSRFDCSKIKTSLVEAIEPWQKPLERFLGKL